VAKPPSNDSTASSTRLYDTDKTMEKPVMSTMMIKAAVWGKRWYSWKAMAMVK
jgi:hypothetical protein